MGVFGRVGSTHGTFDCWCKTESHGGVLMVVKVECRSVDELVVSNRTGMKIEKKQEHKVSYQLTTQQCFTTRMIKHNEILPLKKSAISILLQLSNLQFVVYK